MTLEELINEGRRLQRPCVLLRATGLGPVAATWHPERRELKHDSDFHRWITVDCEAIPGWDGSERYLSVLSDERVSNGGRIESLARRDPYPGVDLHAEVVSVLPPIDALGMYGSPAVKQWLQLPKSLRGGNADLVSPLVDPADAYERVWQREHPLYRTGEEIYAMLGGWHVPWPDGDWEELATEQLLVMTFRDSEPWIEAWRMNSGELRVVQRIT